MSWWEWVFSGIGVTALKDWILGNPKKNGASLTAQGAKIENSPVASGSNISQTVNSPTTLNLTVSAKMADEDSWPDVILECQWPSLLGESSRLRIPGSHTVKKRPLVLRYRGTGAVYNLRVHPIRFGAYEAVFLFPVSTLTDTASVFPVICRKSDRPDMSVVTTHDLESLIQKPPSDADVRQYAIETEFDEDEDEGIESQIAEVEIPVTVSYEDKSGNQFKIKYALKYNTYAEKGEMIRIGKIEKIAPMKA